MQFLFLLCLRDCLGLARIEVERATKSMIAAGYLSVRIALGVVLLFRSLYANRDATRLDNAAPTIAPIKLAIAIASEVSTY